jgi:hypothetical protein
MGRDIIQIKSILVKDNLSLSLRLKFLKKLTKTDLCLEYASKYTAGHYWGHSYMDLIPCKPVKEICDGETCSD